MDLASLFTQPFPLVAPAAIGVPLLLGVFAYVNRSEKERNRKGWHPVTKAAVWTLGGLVAVVAGIWAIT